jgi:ABC-type dipeptide/oligopeptide/nickel transport system permease subunit
METGSPDTNAELCGLSGLKRFWKAFAGRKVVVFGAIVIVCLVCTAMFAPWLAPYGPYDSDLKKALQPPGRQHLLGTDALGRDTLSRIIYGSRTSLLVGIVAVGIASILGMTLGLVAGYFGGLAYAVIMRCVDALMAFPMILKAMFLAALLGGGMNNVMLALGISLISVYARLMCGQVLTVKQSDYVTAARVIGGSHLRIMLFHVLPNCFPPLIVLMTLQMGAAILAEAGLSFLGIGIEPPAAAWGSMVSEGYQHLLSHPILSFAPGLAVMTVVLAFNLAGDGLRDALDPRLRGTL